MTIERTEQAHNAFRRFEESGGIDPIVRDGYIGKGLEIGIGEIKQGIVRLATTAQLKNTSRMRLAFTVSRKGAIVAVVRVSPEQRGWGLCSSKPSKQNPTPLVSFHCLNLMVT